MQKLSLIQKGVYWIWPCFIHNDNNSLLTHTNTHTNLGLWVDQADAVFVDGYEQDLWVVGLSGLLWGHMVIKERT